LTQAARPTLLPPGRLLDLWQNANDVHYVHDAAGRFLAINATAGRVYGYTEAEFLGMSIKDLVDPAHLGTAMENLRAKTSGTTDRSPPYEILTRAKDGRGVWVEVSTRIVHEDGQPAVVQGTARDITARMHAEARAELLHEVALALDQAVSLEAGVQDAIGRIATAAGWACAEAWFPDADGRSLVVGPQWSGADGLEKFLRLARQYRYAPGESLAGRAWRDGRVAAGTELPPDHEFPRRAAAAAAGLRTYAAIPVAHAGRFAAALLFFGTRPTGEDARWVAVAERVAAHIGASIGRRLDTERVRAAGRMFAAQFEALEDALLLLDPEGAPRQANAAFLALCGVGLRSTDAARPLAERVDDPARFAAAVARLYEDRSAGRGQVLFDGRPLRRSVTPLRSRNGQSLGILLRVQPLEATVPPTPGRPGFAGADVC
jgi:PAS domain S-box-containing protein